MLVIILAFTMIPGALFDRHCKVTHDCHLLSLHLVHEGIYSVSRIAIPDGKYVLRSVVKHLSTGVWLCEQPKYIPFS